MAHQLEIINGQASLAFASAILAKVWHEHKQGMIEGDSFDLETALRAVPTAALNVSVFETFLADGRQSGQSTVRADGVILGPVGSSYTPLQTRQMAEGLQTLMPEGQALRLQSLMVLDDGRRVAMQTPPIRITEFPNGKKWETRLLAHNGHDGSTSYKFSASTVDGICSNTVNAAEHEARAAGLVTSGRHTSGVVGNMTRDARWLASQLDALEALRVGAVQALETPLTTDEQLEIVKSLMATTKAGTDELTRSSQKAVNRVMQLSSGVDLIGAEQHNVGSAYGLYAAITQYASQEMTRRFSDAEKKAPALARLNTQISSIMGDDQRSRELVNGASRILLGVGA